MERVLLTEQTPKEILKEWSKWTIVGVIALVLIATFGSAALEDYGTFIRTKDITLTQLCANCTYNNITSIIAPDGTELITNVEMTKSGSKYTYILLANYTHQLGVYNVNGVGNPDDNDEIWAYTFRANAIGSENTEFHGTLYAIVFGVLILGFVGCVYMFKRIPNTNVRNETDGQLMAINWKKYIKWFSFLMAYYLFVAISFFMWNVTLNILDWEGLSKVFQVFFYFTVGTAFPLTIVIFVYMFAKWVQDKKYEKYLARGLTPNGEKF